MNFIELYSEIDSMPESASKVDAIKDAIHLADQMSDNTFSHKFRKLLIDDACYHGNYSGVLDALPAISWIISDLDRKQERLDAGIIDKYQWICRWLPLCPEISKEQMLRLLDDLKKRLTDAGYGLIAYYEALLMYGIETDESETAAFAFKEYSKSKKDYFVDCDACITYRKIKYYEYTGNLEAALKLAEIYNKRSCNQNPKRAYNILLSIAAETGQVEHMQEIQQLGYKLIRKESGCAAYFGAHFLYFAAIDPKEGLKLYKNYIKWGNIRTLLPGECMVFDIGAAVLMKALGNKTFKANIPDTFQPYSPENTYNTKELAAYHYERAITFAGSFDERNRTHFYMEKLAKLYK